jgi:hypothetical protein
MAVRVVTFALFVEGNRRGIRAAARTPNIDDTMRISIEVPIARESLFASGISSFSKTISGSWYGFFSGVDRTWAAWRIRLLPSIRPQSEF